MTDLPWKSRSVAWQCWHLRSEPRDDDHAKIAPTLALLDDEASPLGRVDRERWPALAPATMKGVCYLAEDRWPRLRQTLGDAGCAVTRANIVPGYAMVNAKAGVDVAALLRRARVGGRGYLYERQ